MSIQLLYLKKGEISPLNQRLSFILVLFFLFFISVPCFPQESAEEPIPPTLKGAEELIARGQAREALKVLEKLEAGIESPEKQLRYFLLKARAHISLDERDGCEDAIREIYQRGLSDRIQTGTLEKELRFYVDKVKAEYWFSIDNAEEDEDTVDQRIIEQASQKPKKKSLLPKLILGTVLVGVVVAAVLLIFLGGEEEEDNGNLGTLKFENRSYGSVNIEVGGIVKNVQGTSSNHWPLPDVNKVLIDLMPGTYALKVTYDSEVYTYSISISRGITTHFIFDPMNLK